MNTDELSNHNIVPNPNFNEIKKRFKINEHQLSDLNGIIESLNNFKQGNEILIPIGGAIYIIAKIKNDKELITNIGSGISVKKNIFEVKNILEKKIKELELIKKNLLKEMKKKYIEVEIEVDPEKEVIDYHMVFNGKEWIKNPGKIFSIVSMREEKDVDEKISNIFKKFFDYFENTEYNALKEKIRDCKHKLYAVRYHKLKIEEEIENNIKKYKNDFQPGSGVQFEYENLELIYGIESFLFQVKSNLDLLTQALGFVIPSIKSFRTFKHSGHGKDYVAGGKVIKELNKNNCKELVDLLEKHRTLWIQDLVKMRNTITHYSELKGFKSFVEDPYEGKTKIKIEYPSMPDGEPLDEYCNRIYEDLCKLYEDILDLMIKYNIQSNEENLT